MKNTISAVLYKLYCSTESERFAKQAATCGDVKDPIISNSIIPHGRVQRESMVQKGVFGICPGSYERIKRRLQVWWPTCIAYTFRRPVCVLQYTQVGRRQRQEANCHSSLNTAAALATKGLLAMEIEAKLELGIGYCAILRSRHDWSRSRVSWLVFALTFTCRLG